VLAWSDGPTPDPRVTEVANFFFGVGASLRPVATAASMAGSSVEGGAVVSYPLPGVPVPGVGASMGGSASSGPIYGVCAGINPGVSPVDMYGVVCSSTVQPIF